MFVSWERVAVLHAIVCPFSPRLVLVTHLFIYLSVVYSGTVKLCGGSIINVLFIRGSHRAIISFDLCLTVHHHCR